MSQMANSRCGRCGVPGKMKVSTTSSNQRNVGISEFFIDCNQLYFETGLF